MALLSVIRRWHLGEGMPIREIAQRTGLSRNTIRKYLRAGTVEPKFKVPRRPSKLDAFAEKLSGLRIEAGKSRKQKRTARQMHADLVALGYDGSYGRVSAFVRAWKADRQRDAQTSGRGTFVPLVFAPGEAFQFDWSEDWALLGGERVKLQAAHTKLSHSRAFIVRAYPLQTHEMLFDALTQAFRVLGGVPRRGIFDNMKTAVDRIGSGKARQVNARFAAMASPPCHQSPGLMAKRSGICSSPSSVTPPPAGRRARSRRTFRMRAAGCGSSCRASPIWTRSTTGSSSAASSGGARSSMASCPARSPRSGPRRSPA